MSPIPHYGEGRGGARRDAVAAGWYPDPEVSGGTRYWDGQTWTEHRRPPPPQPPPPSPARMAWRPQGGWFLWIGVLAVVGFVLIPPLLGATRLTCPVSSATSSG